MILLINQNIFYKIKTMEMPDNLRQSLSFCNPKMYLGYLIILWKNLSDLYSRLNKRSYELTLLINVFKRCPV